MASILDLADIISARTTIEERIASFQSKGLLARTNNCNHAMEMQGRNDINDKLQVHKNK